MKNKRNEQALCTHIKSDGQRCGAIAGKKTGLCCVHSGFKPRLNTKLEIDKGHVHIKIFIARLIHQIRKGKVSPPIGNSIIHACKLLLEISNFEREDRMFREYMNRIAKNQGTKKITDLDCLDL